MENNCILEKEHNLKTDSGFKTISVVSKELDVPQYVLRFWEKNFTQISPVKRKGGRRFYRVEDIENIKKIKTLLYDKGYTIKGVKKLFRESKSCTPYEKKAPSITIENTKDKKAIQSVLNKIVEIRALLD